MEPAFIQRWLRSEKYSAPCAWQASSITIEVVALRQFHDRIHVGRMTIEMNRDDTGNRTSGPLRNQLSRSVPLTLVFEEGSEFFHVHRGGLLVDVNKFRLSAHLRNSFRGRDESVRNRDHAIAFGNARRRECKPESIGTTADTNTKTRIAESRELALEALNCRPADESCTS